MGHSGISAGAGCFRGEFLALCAAVLLGAATTPAGAAPFAYITDAGGSTVTVIDTATNTIAGAPVTVGNAPYGVAVDAAGARVYVANYGSDSVSVIDGTTNTVIGAPIIVGSQPLVIAVDAAGTRAYVANNGGHSVSVIDTATRTVLGAPITVGTNPWGIAVNPAGTRVYVANRGDGTVSVIDTATQTLVGGPVTVGDGPIGVAVHPDGSRVYVGNFSNGTVSVIDAATSTVTGAPIAVGNYPVGLALNRDGSRLYVTNEFGTNTVSVIDTATGTPVGSPISVGSMPWGLALNPAGTRAYVANNFGGSVSVIDTKTGATVGAPIAVGGNPASLGQFIAATGACIAAPSGLAGWWTGNHNALDAAGTHDGTLHGTAGYGAGWVGEAFTFDGAETTYVEMPDSTGLNPAGAFTVDGWFYVDPAQNSSKIGTLAAKSEGSTGDGWALYLDNRDNDKTLRFIVGANASAINAIAGAGWYHVAGVYDPAAMPRAKLYLDGVVIADSGATTNGPAPNGYPVRIGAMHWTDTYHQGNDRLRGKADEVQYFSRALSAAEISAIHEAGPAGLCATPTVVALAANLDPTAFGQTVVFTAAVTGPGALPTGLVDFVADAATPLCTGIPLAGGQATCATAALATGTHAVTAAYAGDSGHPATVSPALPHTVGGLSALVLTVTRAGSGSGTVSSDPPGIGCGADCTEPYAAPTPVVLTATPGAGAVFSGWLGACTGTGPCNLALDAATQVSATFAPAALAPLRLDIEGNGHYDALTDGLLILRYLFGLTGPALVNGAVGPDPLRGDSATIESYLLDIRPLLDVDGNGRADALTDGLMIIRYLFGLRGNSVVAAAIGPGASRTDADAIQTYIQTVLP